MTRRLGVIIRGADEKRLVPLAILRRRTAALLLATKLLIADDTLEQARQKAIKKAHRTRLIAAAKQGDVGQVRAQLQAGADINARDGGQRTALLSPFAARSRRSTAY